MVCVNKTVKKTTENMWKLRIGYNTILIIKRHRKIILDPAFSIEK